MLTRIHRSTTALVAALAVTVALAIPANTHAQGNSQPGGVTIPVTGTVVGGGTFNGALELTRFAFQNGQLVAVGTLSGILTAAGNTVSIVQSVAIPTAIGQATCDILHLDLGPLSLNLLGLQVDLSRIVLDITAQSGAGNLLGNLLCAVAGLLDPPGSGLLRVLNDILGLL